MDNEHLNCSHEEKGTSVHSVLTLTFIMDNVFLDFVTLAERGFS